MRFSDHFQLHDADLRIVRTLLVIALIALVAIALLDKTESESTETATSQIGNKQIATANNKIESTRKKPYYRVEEQSTERFAFDPNSADSTQLLRLGLQPYQVRSIYRYRAKGGVYRSKEDFAHVYGLTVKQYQELAPYITIGKEYLPATTLFAGRDTAKHSPTQHREPNDTATHFPRKLLNGQKIELSKADTFQLKRVPGIGSYWAKRIANYGERLGGYVSIDQLNEVDPDFPCEVKQYFDIASATPRRMNLNTLSLNELKRHPYINYYQARAIVDYRRRNGPLHSLNDLQLLPDFTPEAIQRLQPYVTF